MLDGGTRDARVEYILDTARSLTRSKSTQSINSTSTSAINYFIQTVNCNVLNIQYDTSSDEYTVTTDVISGRKAKNDENVYQLYIVKNQPNSQLSDNVSDLTKQLCITSSYDRAGSLTSMYNAVHNLYMPLLLNTSDNNDLAKNIKSLDAILLTTCTERDPGSNLINNLDDERRYWMKQGKSGKAAAVIEQINVIHQKVYDSDGQIRYYSMDELLEILSVLQDALSDLYTTSKQVYPQPRMTHTLDMLSEYVCQNVARQMDTAELFGGRSITAQSQLTQWLHIMHEWQTMCADLSTVDWQTIWSGDKYVNSQLVALQFRLQQIQQYTGVIIELINLFGRDEQSKYGIDKLSRVFTGVNLSSLEYASHRQWQTACDEYNRLIVPAEAAAASMLKSKLFALSDRPQLLVRELRGYTHMLQRRSISHAIQAEKQQLVTHLTAQVKQMQAEFDAYITASQPNVADSILHGHKVSARLSSIQSILSVLFSDSKQAADFDSKNGSGLTHVTALVTDVIDRVTQWCTDTFKHWERDQLSAVKNQLPTVTIDMDGNVIKLDKRAGGKLRVTYSEQLVVFVRNVRSMCELDYKIDERVLHAVSTAEKFYRNALRLTQIANTYNNMSSEINESQLGMLLLEAQQFEKLINSNDRTAQWSQLKSTDQYVEMLDNAAVKLSGRNRKLKAIHSNIGRDVTELLNIDLLKQRDRFSAVTDRIRSTIEREAKNNTSAAIQTWKKYWDEQLYKAMYVQYQGALQSMIAGLSSRQHNVELTYSNKFKCLRVTRPKRSSGAVDEDNVEVLEDIKSEYYKDVRDVIEYPKLFTGLLGSESSALFATIPHREQSLSQIAALYQQTEQLFADLQRVPEQFDHWVELGRHDMEAVISEHCKDIADWKTQFNAVRQYRIQADKLADTMQINCFTVSLLPIKSVIEKHVYKFNEALMLTLASSATEQRKQVDQFLVSSLNQLKSMPKSVSEMSVARQAHIDIGKQRSEMQMSIMRLQQIDGVLREQTSRSLDGIDQLNGRYNDFNVQYDAFADMLQQSADVMKNMVQATINDVNSAIDKFETKYREIEKLSQPDAGSNGLSTDKVDEFVVQLGQLKAELDEIDEQCQQAVTNAEQCGLTPPQFTKFSDMKERVLADELNWSMYTEYISDLKKMSAQLWITFRSELYKLDDYCLTWMKKVKATGQSDTGNANSAYQVIQRDIKSTRDLYPLLQKCVGYEFEKEHWADLIKLCKLTSGTNSLTLTVQQLLDAREHLVTHSKQLNELCARAVGERDIRASIEQLEMWKSQSSYTLIQYTTSKQQVVSVITEFKDVFTALTDNVALAGALKASPFYARFEDRIKPVESALIQTDVVVHTLQTIQRKWLYLEPIFARDALPSEQPRFERANTDYCDIMSTIQVNNQIMSVTTIFDVEARLNTILQQLERCQKALSSYLEQKRNQFPRFYFIGDDDLLEILGQSMNVAIVNRHTSKLFAGIHTLMCSDKNNQITGFRSNEGEVVELMRPVNISMSVETYLSQLTTIMVETLKQSTAKCVASNSYSLQTTPSQVICLHHAITFTQQCEAAIVAGQLSALQQQLTSQLATLTSATHDTTLLQLKSKSLVMDVIHSLDVVKQLIRDKVTAIDAWQWNKQLRYYINSATGDVKVCMVDAVFEYTFEYIGNVEKLVHTPLSDKCYLVLTSAMHLGYGGAPFGPAGTGKTESVKALGQYLGRQTLVFNCDEGIDFQSLGRIFTGLVRSGAWGCFDEFNRLKEDQLSAVSQQIQVIQAAIKRKQQTCELLGLSIPVNLNAAIFVTMNPASKEYGGRSKLPHNLKQLFRDVSMSQPDVTLISEVILRSEGFTHADVIGRKTIEVFELSRQLLSSQRHYDWGLRALKTVLRHAGSLIHGMHRAAASAEGLTVEAESQMLINALKINTLSKLTYSDSVRFQTLLNDVFPGVVVADLKHEQLENAVVTVMTSMKLQVMQTQVHKIVQLYEALNQRMGVVLFGPSGCGKTTCLRVLNGALTLLGQQTTQHVLNPKSMDRTQLLGHMDMDTREWHDGVLTSKARAVIRDSTDIGNAGHSWIVCDGDVDPEWIESLNSVLDDNHLLTLPNGERMQFNHTVNFVFETNDLQYASPATVSRMGMIYMSDEDIDMKSFVTAWSLQLSDQTRSSVTQMLDKYMFPALQYAQTLPAVVPTTDIGLVKAVLTYLDTVSCKQEFVIGLMRGLIANLSAADQLKMAAKVFELCGEKCLDINRPGNIYYSKTSMDYALYVNDEQSVDISQLSVNQPPVINTTDVQRYTSCLHACFTASSQPILLVGPAGCGKTLLVKNGIASSSSSSISVLHCSADTGSTQMKEKLYEVMAGSTTLRPKNGKQFAVVVLKNINLPQSDKYNTTQLHSFIHQIQTYGGFYDGNNEWIAVDGLRLIATMNMKNGNALSRRLTSNMNILSVEYTDKNQLCIVASTYLSAVLHSTDKLFDNTFLQPTTMNKLVQAAVGLYDKAREQFGSIVQYTPRDVTELICSILRYNLSTQSIVDVCVWECKRIFGDKLPTDEQKQMFARTLASCFASFQVDIKQSDVYFTSLTTAVSDDTASSHHGHVGSQLDRISSADYRTLIDDAIVTYERDYRSLHMTIYTPVLSYISSIDRVLSRPNGSLLLLGSTGAGRKTVLALLTHILRIDLYTPNVTSNYTAKQWRNDIKILMKECGVENKRCILLVEDEQMILDCMLQDLNSLLSSGEISGLYTPAEADSMLQSIKDSHTAYKQTQPSVTLQQFFLHRIQTNMHIVLCMNSRHALYERRLQSNPAFTSHTTTINFATWSTQAMSDVAGDRLSQLYTVKQHDGTTIDRQAVERLLTQIHQSMPDNTPIKYSKLLICYEKICNTHRNKIEGQRTRLLAGLQKLSEAAATVDSLSRDATLKHTAATDKQTEADHALEQISQRMQAVSERKAEVETLKQTLAGEESKLLQRKGAIESELSGVQPVLQAAKDAVGGIKKDNLNEIRSLRAPPTHIRNVLCGVLTLMKQDDLSWENMRKFLGLSTVKEDILNYDAKRLSVDTRHKVESILNQYADSFDAKTIARVNVACAPLAAWVKSVVTYSKVLDSVRPLQDEFDAANDKLNSARDRVGECERDLVDLDAEVADLKVKFGKTTGEAAILKDELSRITSTLTAAQSLLDKLSGERQRWSDQCTEMAHAITSVTYNGMLAAAAVTLLPAQTENARNEYMSQWRTMCHQPTFDVCSFMTTETEMLTHRANGLPADALSSQNAVSILNGVQVPLLIDPNGGATDWLKRTVSLQPGIVVELTCYSDERFANTVELAVRFGKTLILHSVDHIHPYLYPLIRGDLVKSGSRYSVALGGRPIDYNDAFKLYITTRDAGIVLSCNDDASLNVINFSVTSSGLENQLLSMTLQHERPELEAEKSALLADEDKLRIKLAELENELLTELANSQGNLLENTKLLNSLNQTKSQSIETSTALQRSSAIQADLDKQRNAYKQLAITGAKLFFLLTQLPTINNMYTYSLQSFTRLFIANLEQQPDPSTTRIQQLERQLILSTFHDANRSLFKSDRLMFGLHFVHQLYAQSCSEDEWRVMTGQMIQGQIGNNNSDTIHTSPPTWLMPVHHKQYNKLAHHLPVLTAQCRFEDASVWQQWYISGKPESRLPVSGVTPFQRLVVVSTLRPDRAVACIQQYICETLQIDTLNPPSLNLQDLIQCTPNTTPALFLCEGGVDPTADIEQLAQRCHVKQVHQIALGTGQTTIALQQLLSSITSGDWLLLKNCHLVIDWLPQLHQTISNISAVNPSFRLWMTTECHVAFSSMLLSQCVKVSYQAPPGVKQNLLRTLSSWDDEYFSRMDTVRSQLLFILAWFHAIVQERRTYIPQGWTKMYEFSQSDLRSSCDIVDQMCTEICKKNNGGGGKTVDVKQIQWTKLWGLLKYAIYGGRIDDVHDIRVLVTYLRKFMYTDILTSPGVPSKRKLTVVGNFSMPNSTVLNDYMIAVNQLPDIDTPGLFNLPDNVEISIRQNEAQQIYMQLRALSVSTNDDNTVAHRSGERGTNLTHMSAQLAPLIALWRKLHESSVKPAHVPSAGGKHESTYNPIEAFVALEQARTNNLIISIDKMMSTVQSMLTTLQSADGVLLSICRSLSTGQTPYAWTSQWPGPTDIEQYFTHLIDLNQHIQQCTADHILSQPINLSHFFTPTALFIALRQHTAHCAGIPIDQLKLQTSFTSADVNTDQPAVRITNLLLQGCEFTDRCITPLSSSQLYTSMPTCTIQYTTSPLSPLSNTGTLYMTVPMYMTSVREKYISDLTIECKGNVDRYVLNGVCIAVNTYV